MVALVPLVVLVVTIFVLVAIVKHLLHVATPNQVIVLSGKSQRIGQRLVSYRAIRGGRALRVPFLERIDWVDLTNIPVGSSSYEVPTRSGLRVRVDLAAHVRMPSQEPRLGRALECFLGRSRDEIGAMARQVLQGVLVGLAAQTNPADMAKDRPAFERALTDEVEEALHQLGLELDTLRVKALTDEHGYFDALRSS